MKKRLAAQFRFQEVADGEAVALLHDQLLAQRDRRTQARGFRRGILTGLGACGIVLAASIGTFFIVHPTTKQVGAGPATIGPSRSVSEEVSMLRPVEEAATNAEPPQRAPEIETTSAFTTAPPPLSAPPPPPAKVESPPAIALPAIVHPPAGPRLSPIEITTLLERGDTFFSAGDITSARLFYERAADGESGLAALRLGSTFDPVILRRAGVRGVSANPAQALSWYRRARELGVGEAERRMQALETRPLGEPDTQSR
jgi:hypothetical protein